MAISTIDMYTSLLLICEVCINTYDCDYFLTFCKSVNFCVTVSNLWASSYACLKSPDFNKLVGTLISEC